MPADKGTKLPRAIKGTMILSKPPVSGTVAEKWKFDGLHEESVLGTQFATAVVMVATGNAEALIHKKKEYPPCRTIFWEEPRHNPGLENSNNNYAYDAHMREQKRYWSKGGKKFITGPRFTRARDLNGPLIPEEIEHFDEKPIPVFERSITVNPYHRAKLISRPQDRSIANPEREYMDVRTSLLGPTTYSLPDLWTASKSDGLQVHGAGQSVFKSRAARFKDQKGHFLDFPPEHEGTSIPHSRGRSRGAGFRQPPRTASEAEVAAKLAAASISTWDSFQEAPSLELQPITPHTLQFQAEAALYSGMPANKFYQLSLSKGGSYNSTPNRSRVGGSALASIATPYAETSQGRGSLQSRGLRGSRAQSASAYEGVSGASTPSTRQHLKSRLPGFTMMAKDSQPAATTPNHNKSYRRVQLPDGTIAILPITAAGATRTSSPVQLSKSVSFTAESGAEALATLRLQGTGGPQLGGGERGTPSLARMDSYTRGMTPPASRAPLPVSIPPGGSVTTTKDGAVLDDESTVNTAKDSNAASSYSKSMMQKWVPPVSYSSKNKPAIAEVAAIPYQQKHSGRSGGKRSAGTGASFTQAELDELMPINRPFSQGLAEIATAQSGIADGSRPVLSGGYVGSPSAGAGSQRRHDALGAAPSRGAMGADMLSHSERVLQTIKLA